jgi:4-hydroxy-L-threonine phosphate dehydrogenase PdxA
MFRVKDDPIDITFNCCLCASQSRAARATSPPIDPPFLDTFAERALCFEGVAQHSLLSAINTSGSEAVQRHAVTLCSGEQMVLTFQTALQTSIKAQYKGLVTEPLWVLVRIFGEGQCPQVRYISQCSLFSA